MGIDTRWTKSGNMIFDDNAEIVGVIKDEVIEFDSTKIGGGGGIDPEIEEKVAGLCEYSTEEVNTGKEWIDGKRIFRKTFYNNSGQTLVSFDLAHAKLIDYFFSDMLIIGTRRLSYDSLKYEINSMNNNSSVRIQFIGSGTPTEFYFTVEYTKE